MIHPVHAKCGGPNTRPYWWSKDIEKLLLELAGREPNSTEEAFMQARALKKPNRLGVVLEKTAGELANELLRSYQTAEA